MAAKAVWLTEPVKNAIIERRAQLEEELAPNPNMRKLAETARSHSIGAATNDFGSLISKARELGALDHVVASFGSNSNGI